MTRMHAMRWVLTGALTACVGLAIVAVPLVATSTPASAAPLPTGFQEQVVFAGLTQPTNVEFSPDGRVFVAEKSGIIKVFDGLADTSPTIFADLTTNVFNVWDRGLLGMALAPNFPADPWVYVLYTLDAPPGQTAPYWNDSGCGNANSGNCIATARLSRLQAAGNQMTGSEQVLITDWCQQFPSHSIGDLRFGPDGMLYISSGDAASFSGVDYGQLGTPVNPCGDPAQAGGALRSQDLRTSGDPVTLDGSILRVTPSTGAAAPGNPLIANTDLNARRVVAYGLRNPFRFTFRPGTSEIWIGDVGWNKWEEINRIVSPTAGVTNFGWPCYEGNAAMSSYDSANLPICENLYPPTGPGQSAPHFAWDHAQKVVAGETCPTGSSAAAGVAFYPAQGPYPAIYRGALFFADYARSCIWAMKPTTTGGVPSATNIETFHSSAASPVDLEIGPGGELYYVDIGGTIRRMRYYPSNQPPTAVISATPTAGPAPLAVSFSSAGSTDPDPADEGRLSFAWDFTNDGVADATTPNANHTYTSNGTFTAKLTVTDTLGLAGVATVVISVGNTGPTATISTPSAGTTWRVGTVINFSGSATDPQQGNLPASALTWHLRMQHCSAPTNCHTHFLQDWVGVASGSFVAPDHEYPSYLELELVATDAENLTNTVVRRLDPQTVDLNFATNPPGRQLSVGSATLTTPFTVTAIIGSTTTISAPTPQTAGSTTYTYASWSDGGAQTHAIVAPAATATYTATFTVTGGVLPGLVAGYSFDAGAGTTATDASGNGNTATLNGPTWVAGKYGGALSFDGINDLVRVASSPSLNLTTQMTMAAWIQPTAAQSGWRTILQREPEAWTLNASTGDAALVPAGGVTINGSFQLVSGTAASPVNAWTHVALTYDGTTLRLYVNGVQVATRTSSGPIQTSTSQLSIGGNTPYGEYFHGLIDEVQIYNRALSAADVQTVMNNPVGTSTPDSTPPTAPSGLTATAQGSSQINLGWTASTDNVGVVGYRVERCQGAGCSNFVQVGTPSTTSFADVGLAAGTSYSYRVRAVDLAGNASGYSGVASATTATVSDTTPPTAPTGVSATPVGTTQINLAWTASTDNVGVVGYRVERCTGSTCTNFVEVGTPTGTTFSSTGLSTATTYRFRVRAADAVGNLSPYSAIVSATTGSGPTQPTGLVAGYNFNAGSGTSVTDLSGNANTGTISGATWSTAGRYGGALSFDGNDRVQVASSSSLNMTSQITVAAWVKPTMSQTGWRTIMQREVDSWALDASHTDAALIPAGGVTISGSFQQINATSTCVVNAWTHLAMTYDGATLRFYVNGVQVSSRAVSGSIQTSTNPMWIGGNSPYGEYFVGLIDEARVYNRALTATEVQTVMNTPLS